MIKTHGPVRRYWAWVMERMNKQFKQLIYTTNFKNVEVCFFFFSWCSDNQNTQTFTFQTQVAEKYEYLWSMAMKTRTPLWTMTMPDQTGNPSKNDAPFGERFHPSEKELECMHYIETVEIESFNNIRKCYKAGERFVAGTSFLSFNHDSSTCIGKVIR